MCMCSKIPIDQVRYNQLKDIVKSKPNISKNSNLKLITPISIDDQFHLDKHFGYWNLKLCLDYLLSLSALRNTLIFCGGSHRHVHSVISNVSLDDSNEARHSMAKLLSEKYNKLTEKFEVIFWKDYVLKDKEYDHYRSIVDNMKIEDTFFLEKMTNKAASNYDKYLKRENSPIGRDEFIEADIKDLTEHLIFYMLYCRDAYDYEIYHSARPAFYSHFVESYHKQTPRIRIKVPFLKERLKHMI